jgi:hypothetical protein
MDHDQIPQWSDDDETHTLTRRRLLGAAAVGFVLTGSGLLLPDRLASEAEARPDGAFGGALGGRHGKDRRGRDKRAHQRDRDGGRRRRSKPGRLFHSVFFYVYNERQVTNPNQAASLVFWGGHQPNTIFPDFRFEQIDARPLANGAFTPQSYTAGNAIAVVIDGRYTITATNPRIGDTFVRLDVGGTMTKFGVEGGTRAIGVTLNQNEQTGTTVEGHTFNISRLYDTGTDEVYDVKFT